MPTDLDRAFESLARGFLADHPEISHEWHTVKSWGGDRLDLVCRLGTQNEVFASLFGYQIAVGVTNGRHRDFEDFGRGLPEEQVAQEAFDEFVNLLRDRGHLERGG